ncbi:excisionase family DNA-binding protein [Microbacterium sp. YMB-B2]|uniref:Excisionase family DNA-binding protein n=1 Tax=Microbacterium tenebrionis TaxID=2830665 RepID=A0A9X1LQD7_9MICO|nr:excisionase family DNA-binding protein [Microbacterium tenebrionis]
MTTSPPKPKRRSFQRASGLAIAAESLGVSVKTIRRRISDGTVRGYRVGRLIRVDPDELRRSLVSKIPTAG